MSNIIKLSEEFLADARAAAKVFNRTVSEQVEYWAKIGKEVEESSENYLFIKDILSKDIEVAQALNRKT